MRPGRRELDLRIPAEPNAAAEARDTVRAALVRARPEVCEDVRLLVSELVTNSLRHGGLLPQDEVRIHVRATTEAIRVEVADQGRGFDPAGVTGPREAGGYGLILVKRIASRWGVDPADGVSVWFELDRPYAESA
jgi:anti-sigma regulatory factor (Ser/Thr protein kinase)